jgi:dTDP-4-amino-4,6-dideoxygalactose transaminase
MYIPINVPIIEKEEIGAVNAVLKTGMLTSAAYNGGKNVQEFERRTSSFTKSKFAISVNSGTAALQASLYALDIQRGDEVLVPSFTFAASANAIISTGAKPIFVDILADNYTMDPIDLSKKITKRSKAIMPVHLYGNVAYIDQILEIAKKNNLKVIEDAAQSLGSTYKKKHTGTFGDVGCYSLYPGKVMTSGEGGIIVTNNKKIQERLLMIRNHGMVRGYDTRIFGLNLRLPEISAAIAKEQIKKLPKFINKRKQNAKKLEGLLSNLNVVITPERKYENRNWLLYTILTNKNRDKLLKKLNSAGFGATAYYSTPVHKTPYYNKKFKTKLKVTEWTASKIISLPIHPKVNTTNIYAMSKILSDNIS